MTFRILLLALFCVQVQGGKTALMIVDVQDCFLDKGTRSGKPGTLSVANTSEILPVINKIRDDKACLFDVVVRSQDYHTVNHISFGSTHGLPPFAHVSLGKGPLPITCVKPSSGLASDSSCCPKYYITPYNCTEKLCPNVTNMSDDQKAAVFSSPACKICNETADACFDTTQAMWTDHCVMTADGDSGFPPALEVPSSDIVVQKGNNAFVDSYSAFLDNSQKLYTPLHRTLQDLDVTTLYLMGIATDYTVYFTCIDALRLNYKVFLVQDATRYISEDGAKKALADMQLQGATVIQSQVVFDTPCPATQTAKPAPAPTKSPSGNGSSARGQGSYLLSAFTMMIMGMMHLV